MKKHFKTLLVLLLAFFMALPVTHSYAEEMTIKDMTEREVKLEGPVEKIVAVTPSDAEILYEIGAGDKLIGRGSFVNYPEQVMDLKDVGSGDKTNVEEIIALQPDLVLMGKMALAEDAVKQLEDAGIPVFITDANTIEQVYQNIDLLGQLTEKEDEAAKLVQEMKDVFAEYTEKSKDKKTAKIYYEISPLEFGLWGAGKNTFMDEIGRMLNVENVFGDVNGWKELSEEQVLERNPQVIVTTSMPMEGAPTPIEEILERKGWEELDAIKNKQVYQVNSDEFTRPGPRLMNAIKVLYDNLYGEE